MKEIVLATHNRGKILELEALLAPIHCISQPDLLGIEETGLSFIENAILKARHVSHITKKPALADDSGLVVDALNGRPGVRSARFAGEHATDDENVACLLSALSDVPKGARHARFYCAIVVLRHAEDPVPSIAVGHCDGVIAFSPAGANGFGYDPVFYLPQYQCTFAELPPQEKNKISHRALALKQLDVKTL